MKITPASLNGLLIIEPDVFEDPRGFFLETYHRNRYQDVGITDIFVQDNLSFSTRNTLRGLHYQISRPQAKLVQVITGEVYDVAVDLRKESPTFGKWEGFHLDAQAHRQLFIPKGFAHGFCVMSESAHFLYKCSDVYTPGDEGGILWSDPELGIRWPVGNPIISPKDQQHPGFLEIPDHRLPGGFSS